MPTQALCEWETAVSSHMPHLSKPQVKVLALYSFGMAMTCSCGLTGIAWCLSGLLGKKAKETLADCGQPTSPGCQTTASAVAGSRIAAG